MNDKIPLVSIICTTYNHENFIREALDGFVMQKANFPFEIIVHDDASTDKTAEIAKEYEEKYPYLFVNIYQNINQYSKLDVNIWTDITFPMARGKYIAICEGDDYWTDELKLKKQVDILEMQPKCVLCFHEADIHNLNTGKTKQKKIPFFKNLFNTSDLIVLPWFVPTASIVFRTKNLPVIYPEWYLKSTTGDMPLMLFLSKYGYLYGIREKMSVYNIGVPNGFTSKMQKNPMKQVKEFLSLLENSNKDYFNSKYTLQVNFRKLRCFLGRLKYNLITKCFKI